mgnify:CR=1 FL=1
MAVSRINEAGLNVNQYGNRNLVINGAMNVAQRGTSSTSSGVKTIDRFAFNASSYDEAAFTQTQSSVAPSGFVKSYRIDCTTVESTLAADEIANVSQVIEAQNLQHIQNGSSDAKSLTLSFYVKSNKTGTYTVNFYKPDNTARHISSTYTINTADTWEYKTITIAGDTSGGGIANDTGAGLYLYWILSAGSDYTSSDSTSWGNYANAGFAYGQTVNIFDSTSNDWAVTGVQLEVGDTATDFEHRSFGDELARCQRYFLRSYDYGTATGTATSTGAQSTTASVSQTYASAGTYNFPVEMRATPTVTLYSTANANTTGKVSADSTDGTGSASFVGTNSVFVLRSNDSTGVSANIIMKAHLTASSEL